MLLAMKTRNVIGAFRSAYCQTVVYCRSNCQLSGRSLVVSFAWNQSLITPTDVIQLTLTLKMITALVVETSVIVNNNSPIHARTTFTRTIILNLFYSCISFPVLNIGCCVFSSTVRTRLRTEDIKLRLSIIMTRKRNPIVKSLQQENDSIASFFSSLWMCTFTASISSATCEQMICKVCFHLEIWMNK